MAPRTVLCGADVVAMFDEQRHPRERLPASSAAVSLDVDVRLQMRA